MNNQLQKQLLENPIRKELYPSMGGIILAGGRSSRMEGEMKSLLPFDGSGIPMIQHISLQMSKLCHTVTIAAAYEQQAKHFRELGLNVALDDEPDNGPLVAFHSVIQHSQEDLFWLSACDMPLVSTEAAAWMVQQLLDRGASALIPEIGGKLHPLQAIYSKNCKPILASLIAAGERSMQMFLKQLNPLIVSEEAFTRAGIHTDFVSNINTPEEYKRYVLDYHM